VIHAGFRKYKKCGKPEGRTLFWMKNLKEKTTSNTEA
jgi:hypothetical protein